MPSPLPPSRFRLPAAILSSLLLVGVSAATAASPGSENLRSPSVGRAATPSSGQAALRASLGAVGVVGIDPVTGTPRFVARLDGFLTEPSTEDPADVVLGYVREHPDVFGLDEEDLAGLRLVRDETDAAGAHHLLWAQTAGGIPAFANDLRATVTSDGRLLTVGGSPVPDLELPADPSVGAPTAVVTALRAAGRTVSAPPRATVAPRGLAQATRFAGGHDAALVLVTDGDGTHLAWRVTASADSDEVYTTLVDARNGDVLASANKVTEVGGQAWDYYPGAASGGAQSWRDFTALGWLSASATTLSGTYARVFSDWNDDDAAQNSGRWGSEETDPTDSPAGFPFQAFTHANGLCAPNAHVHEHVLVGQLRQRPVPAADGVVRQPAPERRAGLLLRQRLPRPPRRTIPTSPGRADTFADADKVVAHASDGAMTGTRGSVPRRGHAEPRPREQREHVHAARRAGAADADVPLHVTGRGRRSDPTPDVNGGDDAAVVYHEYTHGLSNRLITYADGWGALDAFQSAAMGEGWSDWYAMDYLVAKGFAPNTAANGEVTLGRYVGNGKHTLRTEGLDCPKVSGRPGLPGQAVPLVPAATRSGTWARSAPAAPRCTPTARSGRRRSGTCAPRSASSDARFLVTEAMRLSPTNPSFLDDARRHPRWPTRSASPAAARIARPRSGRSSPPAGWATSRRPTAPNDMAPVESFALPPDRATASGRSPAP